MKIDLFIRAGRYATLSALFLLPWQTRYIFWRPWVGTTESEFGVISLYATMLIGGVAALCFFIVDFLRYVRSARLHLTCIIGTAALVCLAVFVWIHTYPSVVHAWILHVFFAMLLGYGTYKTSQKNPHDALFALAGGLVVPALLGIWQMLTGFSPESTFLGIAARNAEHLGDAVLTFGDTRVLRMYGSFSHPNIFGAALALTLAGNIAVFTKNITELPRKTLRKGGVLFIGGIVLILFCVSRSAALALLCAAFVWYGQAHTKKVYIALACVLPVLIWSTQFVAPELLALRGNTPIEAQSVSERVAQVNDWTRIMEQNGLLGVGIYHYPESLANLEETPHAAWVYQPVHNTFMLIIAETGVLWALLASLIVGRGAWIARERLHFFLPLVACLWSLAWFDHVLWTSWVGMAYTAAVLAISVHSKEN